MTLHIEQAQKAELPTCARLIADALRDDPVIHRIVPGEHDRVRRLTDLYTAVLRTGAAITGSVDVARLEAGGPIIGVAAWEGTSRKATLWQQVREWPRYLRAIGLRNLATTAQAMRAFHEHRPAQPYWYLADIAVGPAARGHGVGSALLRHRLRIIDSHAVPAYLEATTLGSRQLYERFGFRVNAAIGTTPDGYPMAMLRPASAPSRP